MAHTQHQILYYDAQQ